MDTRSERAYAVLVGAAYGDALAMPTCGMTPEQITSVYGDFKELIDADASHTTMPGAPAGTVTEVTREILAEASALLGGSFSFPVAADDVHSPTDHTHARRCVLRAIPVGIATSTQDPEAFADAVWEACTEGPTTRQEFQAAALIAAFISIGLDWPDSRPMDIRGVLWETVNYVASMEPRGSWSAEPDVLATTRRAANVVSCQRSMYFSEFTKAFGHPSTPTQIVPFALAFTLHVLLGFSPYVARLGGDTTSCSALVAALMGSVLGASAFRDDPLDAVEEAITSICPLSPVSSSRCVHLPPAIRANRPNTSSWRSPPPAPHLSRNPVLPCARASRCSNRCPHRPHSVPCAAMLQLGVSSSWGSSCSTSRYAQLPSPRREGTCGPTMRGCA